MKVLELMFTLVPVVSKAHRMREGTAYFTVGLSRPIPGTSPWLAGCYVANIGMGCEDWWG